MHNSTNNQNDDAEALHVCSKMNEDTTISNNNNTILDKFEHRLHAIETSIAQHSQILSQFMTVYSQQQLSYEALIRQQNDTIERLITRIKTLENKRYFSSEEDTQNNDDDGTVTLHVCNEQKQQEQEQQHGNNNNMYQFSTELFNSELVERQDYHIIQKANGFSTTALNRCNTSCITQAHLPSSKHQNIEYVEFEITSMNKHRCMIFGIVRADECDTEHFCSQRHLTGHFDHCYSVCLYDGHKRKGATSCGLYFPKDCQTGDVIGIELNVTNRSLSFYRNGQCMGIAFDHVDTSREWIFAVTMWYSDDSITLITQDNQKK